MTAIKRGTLSPRIAEALFRAIFIGELKPGARIKEANMAKELHVGVSTLREALQALADSGLVTRKRTTLVIQQTLEDAQILLAVRDRLEPLTAAFACARLTPAHAGILERHLEKIQRAIRRRDWTSCLRHDLNFHQCIWKVPHVRTLDRMFRAVFPPLFVFFLATYTQRFSENPLLAEMTFRKEFEEHRKLLAVLKTRNPNEAKKTFAKVTRRYWQLISDVRRKPAPTK